MAWRILSQRLEGYEKRQGERNGFEDAPSWYQFLVRPTCPPSSSVVIRGGTLSPGNLWGWIMRQSWTEATTCDFAALPYPINGFRARFANAAWYAGLILCYQGDWLAYRTTGQSQYQEPYTFVWSGQNYETSGEAERSLDELLNGAGSLYPAGVNGWLYYLFPLWAIVLRNNGLINQDGQILPIEIVNRGASYLYRDARPRTLLSR